MPIGATLAPNTEKNAINAVVCELKTSDDKVIKFAMKPEVFLTWSEQVGVIICQTANQLQKKSKLIVPKQGLSIVK